MESNNILTSLKQAAEVAVKDVWAALVEAVKKALAAIKKMHDDALRKYRFKLSRLKHADECYLLYATYFVRGKKFRAWLVKKYFFARFVWKIFGDGESDE